MNSEPSLFYEFGPFRVNVQERFLERESELVPLTPKVFETLLVLVENSGHVLAKDDLMKRLWPDTFVEESSLTQNISLLRRALDEAPGSRQYIETIPKRGYRFVADVRQLSVDKQETTTQQSISTKLMIAAQIEEEVSEAPGPITVVQRQPQPAAPVRNRIVASAIAAVFLVIGIAGSYFYHRSRVAAGAAPASIAVLPFKTIGDPGQTEVLGLGMADALIIRLSHLSQTTVLPTSSVSRYASREKDAVAIGNDLGVEAVLDGTVQRVGDQVRITAQLIRLSDQKTIWTAKFDQDNRNIFTLQDSISEQLAASLIPKLSAIGNGRDATGPANQEAYEAYLTGLYLWNQRTKESLAKSLEYFGTATQKDPNYARAYAMIGDVYFLSYADGYDLAPPNEALIKANEAISKALQLDENLAEAHVTKAGLLRMDAASADQEYRRALELNPNQAVGHLRYSYWLFNARNLDEALKHARRAVELDPTSPVSHIALGFMLSMSRDHEGAAAQYTKALELQPEQVVARYNMANVYVQKRMYKEALAEFERVESKDHILGTLGKAYVYASSGKRDATLQELSKLQKESPAHVGPLNVVILYGMIGDKDTAFELLDKIDPVPFVLARLKFDPDLDPLRGDQKFDEYLKRHHIENL
jgi:DNA-binding winged helix-turn-helix (wHTH) protein/TolB-like protein/Tfp pilus assembly protein PilF